jgi:hypothetical protein
VVLHRHAGEDTGVPAAQRLRVDARTLHRLPGDLQHQPLLGIQRQRLARTYAEEAGIEVTHPLQEPSAPGVRGAVLFRVRVVQPVQVPATVVRKTADGVPALGDQPPQRLRGVHTAGQSAAHADDDHRVVRRVRGLLNNSCFPTARSHDREYLHTPRRPLTFP